MFNFLKRNKNELSKETLNLYRSKVIYIKSLILNNNDNNYLSMDIFYDNMHQIWIYLANIIEYYANKNNIKYRKNIYFEKNNHFLSRSKILEEFSKSLIKKGKVENLQFFSEKLLNIDLLFFNSEPFIFNNEIIQFNIFDRVKLSIFIIKNIDALIELDDFCRNN